MSGNTLGTVFTINTFGESHDLAIGCVIDGCLPGMEFSEADIQPDLDSRKPGTSRHVTQRREEDLVEILSGVYEGKRGKSAFMGRRKNAKTKGEVDFWDQTGIHALYGDYKLVYVGQAGLSDKSSIGNRLKTHTTNDLAGRWNMFSSFGLRKVGTGNKLGARFELAHTTKPKLANVLEGVVIEMRSRL